VLAASGKAEARPGDQVDDDARDEYLAGPGRCSHTRGDVDGDAADVVVAQLDLARVHARPHLIAVAVELFSRHSYAGTSLQMIADELGFSKGAIYHHFRTREDLLHAIVAPMLERLQAIVQEAEQRRTPRARAEQMLCGYAAHLAANRQLAGVLALDPGVLKELRSIPDWDQLIHRQSALFAAVDTGPAGLAKATFAMAGMAAAADPRAAELSDDALCQLLVETGRRALALPIKRSNRSTPSS
jgi:AcrR family transcriptional regulator